MLRHGRDAAFRLRIPRRGFRPGDARDAGCAGAPRSALQPHRTRRRCSEGPLSAEFIGRFREQRARRRARVHTAARGTPDARVRIPARPAASVSRRMEPIRRARMGEPGRANGRLARRRSTPAATPRIRGPQAGSTYGRRPSRRNIAMSPNPPPSERGPIFIGGLSGSGKTQLRLVLGAHPDISHDAPQLLVESLLRTIRIARRSRQPRTLRGRDGRRPRRAAPRSRLGPHPARVARRAAERRAPHSGSFTTTTRERLGKRRWGEQLRFVECFADPIFANFPTARMIHMVRDPRTAVTGAGSSSGPRPGKLGWELAVVASFGRARAAQPPTVSRPLSRGSPRNIRRATRRDGRGSVRVRRCGVRAARRRRRARRCDSRKRHRRGRHLWSISTPVARSTSLGYERAVEVATAPAPGRAAPRGRSTGRP